MNHSSVPTIFSDEGVKYITVELHRDEIIEALQSRFRMIPDDGEVAIGDKDGLIIHYRDEIMGCPREIIHYINIEWVGGLICSHIGRSMELHRVEYNDLKEKPLDWFVFCFEEE